MAQIYEEVRGQNHFWSKYLTVYFAVYILEIAYLSYAFFFTQTESFLYKVFFAFLAIEFAALLLYITLECSQIVACNRRTHWRIWRILMTQNANPQQLNKSLINETINLDQMAAGSRTVEKVCFKLVNNYRINSQMFQLVKKLFAI